MGSFERDLNAFQEKTMRKLDIAIRKISLDLFERVINLSPVDTGRFKGNWQVAIGQIPNGTLELDDKTGTATINAATAVASGIEAGDIVYLVNNLPYAQRLEDGSSAQAPNGMVALSVQEFQKIAEQVGLEVVKI